MVNKVILVGRVGRDAELKHSNGTARAEFSIATSESWKDKNTGEKNQKTEWHNCQIWGKSAESLSKYILKGSMVYAEGKIQSREWTDDSGSKRRSTNIIVDRVQFLGGKPSENREDEGCRTGSSDEPQQPEQSVPQAVADDDLPF